MATNPPTSSSTKTEVSRVSRFSTKVRMGSPNFHRSAVTRKKRKAREAMEARTKVMILSFVTPLAMVITLKGKKLTPKTKTSHEHHLLKADWKSTKWTR